MSAALSVVRLPAQGVARVRMASDGLDGLIHEVEVQRGLFDTVDITASVFDGHILMQTGTVSMPSSMFAQLKGLLT